MTSEPDLLVVGSGPAGMSAAIQARQYGLEVLVVDEQSKPGGQIWREVESVGKSSRADILGPEYIKGLEITEKFRSSGAKFSGETTLWHIESGPVAYVKTNETSHVIRPKAVVLATGAQERPVPFPGWTLPGVMTIGAAQIMLKSSDQVPNKPVWIAGCGPLALLYSVQLLNTGAELGGFLDTSKRTHLFNNLPDLFRAVFGAPLDLVKGIGWLLRLKLSGKYFGQVSSLQAIGTDRVEKITFETRKGKNNSREVNLLLVHEGIVPTIHPTLALSCKHVWKPLQNSYAPELNEWGETSEPFVFVAGDGAGIGGAKAACLRGAISSIGIARGLGFLTDDEAVKEAKHFRKKLKRVLSVRPFLDKLFQPRAEILAPSGETIACRCEEVTADQVRSLCKSGCSDPNEVKSVTRAGMGPCQGRLCNYTVTNIIAAERSLMPQSIGLYRVRPPFKPLTIGELALLDQHGDPK